MTLWDELYFEITLCGAKADVKKFISFLEEGGLDDFFEMDDEYIMPGDNYHEVGDTEETELIFSNDDYGIEIEEIDSDDFLETLCRAGRRLEIHGYICDAEGNEYNFTSPAGESYYLNSRAIFNDELDAVARDEDKGDDE